jgi:hypothetical protein
MEVKDFNQQLIAIGGTMSDSFHPADSDEANTTKYYGMTTLGGHWIILRETNTAEVKTYRVTFGKTGYTTAWTGRAALDYYYWYELRGLL